MKKFEYKTESYWINILNDLDNDTQNLRKFLDNQFNKVGQLGWELVSYPETQICEFQNQHLRYLNLLEIEENLEQNNLPNFNKGFKFTGGYLKFCFKREIQKLPFCLNCDHLLYCDKIKEWKSQYKDSIVLSMIQDTCCNKFK